MLIISIPTTTAKHAFLVMKIQRTRVYNKMEDDIRDINKKKKLVATSKLIYMFNVERIL